MAWPAWPLACSPLGALMKLAGGIDMAKLAGSVDLSDGLGMDDVMNAAGALFGR